jgi:hypothetical protein
MSEDHGDELAQARAFLLAAPGPAIPDEAAALRLLAALDVEVAESPTGEDDQPGPDAFQIAGHRRRRAYVWAHLAQRRSEFEDAAAAAVRAWQQAEAEAARAALQTVGR